MRLVQSFADHADRLAAGIAPNRYPLEKIKAVVTSPGGFISVVGEDEYLRPAFVNAQAAKELALAHKLRHGGIRVTGVIHTPNLVKPLTVWPSTQGEGMDPAVWNDPERRDTVRIRAQEALPAFMEAGGILIAAAVSTKLSPAAQTTLQSHIDAHPNNLIIRELKVLPPEMIGASYFIENDDEISFAYIRSRQSDDVRVGTWTLAMGDPNDPDINPNFIKEHARTLEFLAENDIKLG